MTNGNGTNRLLYWLLGILAATLLSVGGAWAMRVDRQLERLADVHEELRPKTAVIEQRVNTLEHKLGSIDDKIDRLLQQQRMQ